MTTATKKKIVNEKNTYAKKYTSAVVMESRKCKHIRRDLSTEWKICGFCLRRTFFSFVSFTFLVSFFYAAVIFSVKQNMPLMTRFVFFLVVGSLTLLKFFFLLLENNVCILWWNIDNVFADGLLLVLSLCCVVCSVCLGHLSQIICIYSACSLR